MIGLMRRLGTLLGRLFSTRPFISTGPRIDQMPGGDLVVWNKDFGPEMDQAIQAAKETLPIFWDWHGTRSDDPDDCALKMRCVTIRPGSWEYIWLVDILRTGDVITGLVCSEPKHLPDLKIWEPTVINLEEIVDWTFRKDGVYYGHYTTRVLARSYPELGGLPEDISEAPLPADIVRP